MLHAPLSIVDAIVDGTEPNGFIVLLATIFAIGLATVHLFAGRLRFLDVIPRSRWLSMSGGAAVAYVFIHILPEIQRAGEAIERSDSVLVQVEHHVYLIALIGMAVFYGLERLVRGTQTRDALRDHEEAGGIFWVHIGSFAVYNGLIGYLLLHQEEPGLVRVSTFFVAMALHLFVNDYGLREHHGDAYHQYGRWILSVAVFVGLAVGYVIEVDELGFAVLFAFLGGGTILNVMKEELPAERQSRFWAFAVGAAGYSLLLVLL